MKNSVIFENKKISFDFDGTLVDDFYGELNNQKEEIQNICKNLIDNGYDVHIVTKRYGEIYKAYGKINEYIEVFKLAEKLGIPKSKIYFTNRDWKYTTLTRLGINVHFENSKNEVDQIKKYCPDTTVVHIEDPFWRDLKY